MHAMKILHPDSFQEFEHALLSFVYEFCRWQLVDESKKEKQNKVQYKSSYMYGLTKSFRDIRTKAVMLCVFTLHLNIGKTDAHVRRPRKSSFPIKLVSQLTFLI